MNPQDDPTMNPEDVYILGRVLGNTPLTVEMLAEMFMRAVNGGDTSYILSPENVNRCIDSMELQMMGIKP